MKDHPTTSLAPAGASGATQLDRDDTPEGMPRFRPAAHVTAPALFGVHEVAAAIVRHLDGPVKDLASLRIVNKQFAAAAWPWLMLHAVKSLKPLGAHDMAKVLAALDTPAPAPAPQPGPGDGQPAPGAAFSGELKGMTIAATAGKLDVAWPPDDLDAHFQALRGLSGPLQGQAYLQAATGLGKALTKLASKAFGRQFQQLANDLAQRGHSRAERARFYEEAMSAWAPKVGMANHPVMFRQIRSTLELAVKAWDPAPLGKVWAALAGTSMRMLDDVQRLRSVQRRWWPKRTSRSRRRRSMPGCWPTSTRAAGP